MECGSKAHQRFTRFLRTSQRILIFTGAGVSTGSGIPDFRGPQGVWTRRQPVYHDDSMRSEEARIEHWDYKLEGWSAFREARPNAVHEAIVELEHAGKLLLLVTQNIDGLHARAGTSPERLVELHGTNLLVECQTCHRRSDPEPHFADDFRVGRVVDDEGGVVAVHAGRASRSISWVASMPRASQPASRRAWGDLRF